MIISGRRVGMPKVSLEARSARETVLDLNLGEFFVNLGEFFLNLGVIS